MERLKQSFPDFDYELVGWSEIDKYAIQAHNALFPQWADRNYGDISKIDWSQVPDFDLFTYSSPCQDFSNAGQQKGGEEGSGTRSSLLWECRRAIIAKRPKYLLFENVPNMASKKHLPLFTKWQTELTSYGYSNFAQMMNAKDYKVPQNRKRLFMVSILGEAWYDFPSPFPLERRLKDVLEENVPDKYFLTEKTAAAFIEHCDRKQKEGCGFKFEPTMADGCAKSITTRAGNRETDNFILVETDKPLCLNSKVNGKQPSLQDRVYDVEGVSPAITTSFMPSIAVPQIIQLGRGFNKGGLHEIAPTISGSGWERNNFAIVKIADKCYRIRKLTPKECFRLMGVEDKDIDTMIGAGISNTQLYKLAGNSIVVDTLYYIFKQAFCEKQKPRYIEQTLF